MIDLHCHILPDMDDGPQTVAAAVAMARACATAGIRAVVATPHVSWEHPNSASRIKMVVQNLSERLRAERVDISLHAGAELAATYVFEGDAEELNVLTLGDGPWLLLEPPFVPVASGFDQIAYSLMQSGHRVVIAHPERCQGFHRDPTMLGEIVRAGALTSVTAGSLAGRFGKEVRRFSMHMFEEGIAHNVASDAHDQLRRPPGMAAEIEWAGLGSLREWLTELVPAAILAGDPIPPRPTFRPLRRRSLMARLRSA